MEGTTEAAMRTVCVDSFVFLQLTVLMFSACDIYHTKGRVACV